MAEEDDEQRAELNAESAAVDGADADPRTPVGGD
jgi:hypothetical protein